MRQQKSVPARIEGMRSISSEVPRERQACSSRIRSGGWEIVKLAFAVSPHDALLAVKKCRASSGFRKVLLACQTRKRKPAASNEIIQRVGLCCSEVSILPNGTGGWLVGGSSAARAVLGSGFRESPHRSVVYLHLDGGESRASAAVHGR